MAKPIVLLGYPSDQPREVMEELTQNLKRYLSDYHVLVFPSRTLDITFEVFNHENNGTKTVEEIKEFINSRIK